MFVGIEADVALALSDVGIRSTVCIGICVE